MWLQMWLQMWLHTWNSVVGGRYTVPSSGADDSESGGSTQGGPIEYVSESHSTETSLNFGVRPARITLSEHAMHSMQSPTMYL